MEGSAVRTAAIVAAMAALLAFPVGGLGAFQEQAPCTFLAASPDVSPIAVGTSAAQPTPEREAEPTTDANGDEAGSDPSGTALGVLDRFPNVLASAKRAYVAAGTRESGTLAFGFGVWETTDEFVARALLEQAENALHEQELFAGLRRASAPPIRDDSLALAGRAEGESGEFDAAILLVRDRCFVHVWFGAGLAADPLPELVEIAERLWSGPALPDDAPLPARLPGLDDLPPGFVLEDEDVQEAG